jgi:hypothetical protein
MLLADSGRFEYSGTDLSATLHAQVLDAFAPRDVVYEILSLQLEYVEVSINFAVHTQYDCPQHADV